jgi:ligand-binding sensor domain-containing protein
VLARVWLALTILALAARVAGSQLPVRSFTIADGLSDNRVHHIVVDSRGLLWISTHGGLSRFDGTSFQRFGITQGLPFPAINDLLEMPDGDFWLGSNGAGLIRFPLSSGRRRYEAFSVSNEPTSNRVNRLVRARDGTIWLGTDGGLFRMTVGSDGKPRFVPFGLRLHGHPEATVQVWSMAEDVSKPINPAAIVDTVRSMCSGADGWEV